MFFWGVFICFSFLCFETGFFVLFCFVFGFLLGSKVFVGVRSLFEVVKGSREL